MPSPSFVPVLEQLIQCLVHCGFKALLHDSKDLLFQDAFSFFTLLAEHAKDGWKLHTIYSNELGKNAVSLLGFGTNSTACEDVLIFERRVESL